MSFSEEPLRPLRPLRPRRPQTAVDAASRGRELIEYLSRVRRIIVNNEGSDDREIIRKLGAQGITLHNDMTNKSGVRTNAANIDAAISAFEDKYRGNMQSGYEALSEYMAGEGGVCVDAKVETLNNFVFEADPYALHPVPRVLGDAEVDVVKSMCAHEELTPKRYMENKSTASFRQNLLMHKDVASGIRRKLITVRDVDEFISSDMTGFSLFADEDHGDVLSCDGELKRLVDTHQRIAGFRSWVPWADLPDGYELEKGSVLRCRDGSEHTLLFNVDKYSYVYYLQAEDGAIKSSDVLSWSVNKK